MLFKQLLPGKLTLLHRAAPALIAAIGLALAMPVSVHAAEERTFNSPNEAVLALATAVKNHDTNAVHLLFGPEGHELISPDVVQATEEFKMFVQRVGEKTSLINHSDSNATLELGQDAWPFPIPLVKEAGRWHFDTAAGSDEILARRIGGDELGAIDVCHAYVEAQHEYASQDRMGDGVLAYAQYLRSTPGRRDGLFWPTNQPGEELSPLGPLVARAWVEGYQHPAKMLNDELAPYHGYLFRILTCQGGHAPGGRFNYLINGRMIAGFALVAWPAEWGDTGIMTFIVNQQGKVYQKNLGLRTAKAAKAMTRYDPDVSWTPVL